MTHSLATFIISSGGKMTTFLLPDWASELLDLLAQCGILLDPREEGSPYC